MRMYIFMHRCIYISMYICVCICIHMYIYVYTCICSYICIYTYIYINMCVNIHRYVHIYICIYVYIYIHIYIYIEIYPRQFKTSSVGQSAGLLIQRPSVRFRQKLQKPRTQIYIDLSYIDPQARVLNYCYN